MAAAVRTEVQGGTALLLRRTDLLSRAVLVAALVAGLLAPDALRTAGPALLVAAAVLGLPHGAVDHLAWSWAHGAARPQARVGFAYAAGALAVVALAVAAPLPALLVLLALAAAHFAEGEVAWARLRGAAVLPGAAVGVVAVAGPLLLRPDDVRPLLAALDPALPGVLLADAVRLPVLGLSALLVAGALVASWRSAGELALVVAVVVVLPPLAAFAAWFAGWHAVRHTARLLLLDPRTDLSREPLSVPLRRFGRAAAVPSAVALVGVGVLALSTGVTAGLLVALLALTVPHTAVVARLGSRRAAPG